ncbi:MAG TPA: hypothetical protein VGE07_03230 [Herpetosiphonaceae bacterium]
MSIYTVLVILHALSGSIVLLSATLAIVSKLVPMAHAWHVRSGQAFGYGMLAIFFTGLPMAVVTRNPFMVLISFFTLYYVVMGWRFARNRRGEAGAIERWAIRLMLAAGVAMILGGAYGLIQGYSVAVVLIVFGGLSLQSARSDRKLFQAGRVVGAARIRSHLNHMLPATTAAVTAFLLFNAKGFEPIFVIWLAPTVVLMPLTIWWERRLAANRRPSGMPEEGARPS